MLRTEFRGSTVPHFGGSIFLAFRTPGRGRRTGPGFRLETFRGFLVRLFADFRVARSPSSGRSGFPCSPVSRLPASRLSVIRALGVSGFPASRPTAAQGEPRSPCQLKSFRGFPVSGVPGYPFSLFRAFRLSLLPGFPLRPVSRLLASRLSIIPASGVSVFPSLALARFPACGLSRFLVFCIPAFRETGFSGLP